MSILSDPRWQRQVFWPLSRWLISLGCYYLSYSILLPFLVLLLVAGISICLLFSPMFASVYLLGLMVLIGVAHTLFPGNEVTPKALELLSGNHSANLTNDEVSWLIWHVYGAVTLIAALVSSTLHSLLRQQPKQRRNLLKQLKGVGMGTAIIFGLALLRYVLGVYVEQIPHTNTPPLTFVLVAMFICVMTAIGWSGFTAINWFFTVMVQKVLDGVETQYFSNQPNLPRPKPHTSR